MMPQTLRSVSAPIPHVHTQAVETLSRQPFATRVPNNSNDRPQPIRSFSSDATALLAPIQSSVPTFQFDPVADEERSDTPTSMRMTGSLAVRAMRSMRSMAKLLMNPDEEKLDSQAKEKSKRKAAKSKSKMSTGFSMVEPTVERRGSQNSHESWLIGAPSSVGGGMSPDRMRTLAAASASAASLSLPAVAQPIVSASVRERMYSGVSASSGASYEVPGRPSGETFGTVRKPKGRLSQETNKTLSTGSGYSAESSESSESSNSSYGDMTVDSTTSRSEPHAESVVSDNAARMSLGM